MRLSKKLGELPALRFLSFGVVPDVTKCFLPSLEVFIMGDGTITKIPVGIGVMQNLKKLDWPCNVTAVDEALWTLATLEELGLFGLDMDSLPQGIGSLASLRKRDLRYAKLTALPESFGDLKRLGELDLAFAGRLSTIPASFY